MFNGFQVALMEPMVNKLRNTIPWVNFVLFTLNFARGDAASHGKHDAAIIDLRPWTVRVH